MFKKIFKDKKNIVIISVLGAFLILGATYALINWTSNNYRVAIRSTCMNINYSNGQDIDTNINAINESQFINGNTLTVSPDMVFSTVSIEIDDACSDVEGLGTIEINVSDLSEQLKIGGKYANSLRYTIVEYDPTDYVNLNMTELSGDTFIILSSGIIINEGIKEIYYPYLTHGEIHNYLIFFYADNTLFDNSLLDLTFEGTISAKVEQFIPTPITSFNYTISGENIVLTSYKGTDTIVKVSPTYMVNDVEYNTLVANTLFKSKTIVEEVYFASGVLSQNGNAQNMFMGCSSLTKVINLPNNITSLDGTFYNCTSLVNAPLIPYSVTDMASTFYNCTRLVNAPVIPNSVTSLSSTFSGCTRLVNAPVIPNSVTKMNSAFSGCTSLVNVPEIPSSVTDMSYTFRNCINLEGLVRINSSLVTTASASTSNPFYYTSKPITVEVPSGSTTYTNINKNKPSNVTIVQY